MPTVTTRYVTWISRGRRHHGAAAADIAPASSTLATSGGAYGAFAAPQIGWTDGMGPHQAGFAFWSVTGGRDGAFVTMSGSLTVPIGGSDVAATAWYLPTGGGGNGGPGVLIDAFDVGLGSFVDDDFVAITPDGSLSPSANEDGFVPTSSLEHVGAFGSIHGVPFDDWTLFAGTEPVSGTDLTATVNSSAVAFAFYKPTAPVTLPHVQVPSDGTWVSWGVTVDAGGPTGRGPVPPWTPFLRDVAVAMAMAEAAHLARPELQAKAMTVAAEQMEAASRSIAGSMIGAARGQR